MVCEFRSAAPWPKDVIQTSCALWRTAMIQLKFIVSLAFVLLSLMIATAYYMLRDAAQTIGKPRRK